ncbi:ABC transporter substrate-binding protein [Oceanicella sp. SM1341]|uniref:ABC transporter substrate-binding protein n=1 Tax=Oceanicella sp. SM1341 TaxID=1548889 RepID=UPI000E4842A8|nr:ABC transporter substrate-binding protein [Oceanicella sp. SM1341]
MRKFTMTAAAAAAALIAPLAAQAQDQGSECGEVSITQMNWASAAVVTTVAEFLMEQGYGCDVSVVPSDTVPAVTSVAENGEPDIVTELWLNSTGEVFERLEDEGKIKRVAEVLKPGGVEGWWLPAYLVEEHPELKTIEGVMAHPEWVGGRFNNCPEGWGCRVVNDNLVRALKLEDSGIEVFNHGSGETMATSMAAAYGDEEPWFGYYWGPTTPLGKFDMVKVDLGGYDEAAHEANQNPDTPDPKVSDFPAAPVLTAVTTDLEEREPEVVELMSKMTFDTDTMSKLLAWQDENNASAEETAVHYLTNYQDEWSGWLSDGARERLSKLLDKS